MGTIFVLLIVVGLVAGAVRSIHRSEESGGCGSCPGCGSGQCAHDHERTGNFI